MLGLQRWWVGLVVLGASSVVACGGSTQFGDDGGADDAASDGAPHEAGAEDASHPDASDGGSDASDGGWHLDGGNQTFLCGNITPIACDGNKEYCDIFGIHAGDGGQSEKDTCYPLPAGCLPTPTCGCLGFIQGSCTCVSNGGELTVDCSAL